MKLSIALLIAAFTLGCASANKPSKVVQTKSGRTIAQAKMAPGQKLNFYSCKSGFMQSSKTINKSKCELVSDINIGTVLSDSTGNSKSIYSLEQISASVGHNWVKCDGEDEGCINSGDAWDWEKISYFDFSDAQSSELAQKLKAAYVNNKGLSLYFNKSQVKKDSVGSQDTKDSYGLQKAQLLIEEN